MEAMEVFGMLTMLKKVDECSFADNIVTEKGDSFMASQSYVPNGKSMTKNGGLHEKDFSHHFCSTHFRILPSSLHWLFFYTQRTSE